jgi:hypothetical protein
MSARIYVLPLSRGEVLPASLTKAKDFLSKAELAKFAGARVIPAGDVGPNR